MAEDGSAASRRPLIVPGGATAVMLLLALGPWPYAYYTLLRWVTCATAAIFAFSGYASGKMWALWTFGFVALLFNPIVPIYLSRETWQPIDLATAVLFAGGALTLSLPPRRVMEGN
jgi:hypothetical protein